MTLQILILRSTARANNIRLLAVKLHVIVKEVKSHTVTTVGATHFGVEIVESATIIFVDVTVFYKDPTHSITDRMSKLFGYGHWLKLVV